MLVFNRQYLIPVSRKISGIGSSLAWRCVNVKPMDKLALVQYQANINHLSRFEDHLISVSRIHISLVFIQANGSCVLHHKCFKYLQKAETNMSLMLFAIRQAKVSHSNINISGITLFDCFNRDYWWNVQLSVLIISRIKPFPKLFYSSTDAHCWQCVSAEE